MALGDSDGLLEFTGRLAHDIVLATFAVLRVATPADQTLVFSQLAGRFQREAGTGRQALCVEALKLCNAETSRDSGRAYELWRRAQPDPHPYPPVAQVRRTLADPWDEVKVIAFGDEQGDILNRRLRRKGDPILDADIRASLLLYANETGDELTQRGYLAWCKVEKRQAGGRPSLPVSGGIRRYGLSPVQIMCEAHRVGAP